jgi:hypothetical protein
MISRAFLIALTLAAAAHLTWACHAMLTPAITAVIGDEVEYILKARPQSGAAQPSLQIKQIIADDRLLRSTDLTLRGEWEQSKRSTSLRLAPDREASIGFRGRRVQLNFKRARQPQVIVIETLGETASTREILIPKVKRRQYEHVVELSDQPHSWWPAIIASLALCVAMALQRPWQNERRMLIAVVAYTGLLHLIYTSTQLAGCGGDSVGYLDVGDQLLKTGQTGYFPPGYSLLVSSVNLLTGGVSTPVSLIQTAFSCLTIWSIWRILRASFSWDATAFACLFVASSITFLATSRAVMSESLTLTTMLGSLALAITHRDTGRKRYGVLAGALALLATATRVIPILIVVPIFIGLHVRRPQRLRNAIWPCAPIIAAMLLWVGVTLFSGKQLPVATSVGGHIYNCVVSGKQLIDRDGAVTRELLPQIANGEVFFDQFEVKAKLANDLGMSAQSADQKLRMVAIEAMLANPWAVITSTLTQASRQLYRAPTMPIRPIRLQRIDDVAQPPLLHTTASAIQWQATLRPFAKHLWPWLVHLFLLSGLCAAFLRRPTGAIVLAAMVALSLISHALAEVVVPRYSTLNLPAVIGLATAMPTFVLLKALSPLPQAGRHVITKLIPKAVGRFVDTIKQLLARIVDSSKQMLSRMADSIDGVACAYYSPAIKLLGIIATAWITYEFWRLTLQAPPKGAHDLISQVTSLQGHSDSASPAGRHGHSPFAAITQLLFGSLLGWPSTSTLRWAAAISTALMLAWLLTIVTRSSQSGPAGQKRLLAIALLSTYPIGASIGNGTAHIAVLACLLATILCPTSSRWLQAWGYGTIATIALIEPKLSLPFAWLVLFRSGWRVALCCSAVFAACAISASIYSAAHMDGSFLSRCWDMTVTNAVEQVGNHPGNHGGDWVMQWQLPGPPPWTQLAMLLGLGALIFTQRRKDIWLLIGISALTTQFWAAQRWTDEIILLPALIALLRLGATGSNRIARWLAGFMLLSLLAPGGIHTLPISLKGPYVSAQVTIWAACLAYLILKTLRSTSKPTAAAATPASLN